MEEKMFAADMAKELNTHDKRYMFLRVLFPQYVSRINLEGPPLETCYRIVDYFLKSGTYSELESAFYRTFR
jgi:hypothetical protein